MKRLVVGAVVAAIATISYIATSADASERPAGVSSKQWVSISPSLGIVLLANEAPTVGRGEPPALQLKPPVGGYFMVRGASGWTRLVVVEPLKGPADAG